MALVTITLQDTPDGGVNMTVLSEPRIEVEGEGAARDKNGPAQLLGLALSTYAASFVAQSGGVVEPLHNGGKT